MSFSTDVKNELYKPTGNQRHCKISELAVYIYSFGSIEYHNKNGKDCISLVISTEHEQLTEKCFTLLKKTFNIVSVVTENGMTLSIDEPDEVESVLQAVKMYAVGSIDKSNGISKMLLKNSCCMRAFLRGCFVAFGSMADPEKSYHLEFVCDTTQLCNLVIDCLKCFEIEARFVLRAKKYVVYIKEGEAISTLLNVMEAHVSLMKLENSRIVKDIKNHTNRTVNCEVANSARTIGASTRQINDIKFLDSTIGLTKLQPELREMAYIRLEYPDVPLAQLGDYLRPPIGKSGVNHRLRRISAMADKLRGGQNF